MRLEKITVEDLMQYKRADCQRVPKPAKVRALYKFYCEKGFFDSLPILVDEEKNIYDGGHRAEAYKMAFNDGKVKNEVIVLLNKNANQETFLNLNKGTPVSLNHKVKINKITKLLESRGFLLSHNTSRNSLSYIDLARALSIVKRIQDGLNIKQSNQEEIFNHLDYFYSSNDLVKITTKIVEIKRKYFEALDKYKNKKYLQKLFLYLVSYQFKNTEIDQAMFDKIISRFPNSMGGDIGLAYNKQLFVDAFNYNLKKESNKINIIDI